MFFPGPNATTRHLMTGWRPLDMAARWLDRVTVVLSMIGTLGIFGLMIIIVTDVMARAAGTPLAGVPEIVAMSILSIVFLQLANTVARGQLTRSDMLLGIMARRAPRLGVLLDAVMHLAGTVLVGVLVNAFWPLFIRTWTRNDTVGTVGQFLAPLWPAYGIVLVGSIALGAVFAIRTVSLLVIALTFQDEAQT